MPDKLDLTCLNIILHYHESTSYMLEVIAINTLISTFIGSVQNQNILKPLFSKFSNTYIDFAMEGPFAVLSNNLIVGYAYIVFVLKDAG